MGAVWSAFQDDKQLFSKSAYLSYSGSSDSNDSSSGGCSSKFAFYQTLKQAVARMEMAKVVRSPAGGRHGATSDDGDMEVEDRAHVDFMLAHWPREMDVVYDRIDEFPFAIPIDHELEAPTQDGAGSPLQQQQTANSSMATSKEEAILRGLSENKLSSSEAIHQAIEQLRRKYDSDHDQFLRILAMYPRATRLCVSQQLHARSNVANAFQLYLLQQDYSRAAHSVSKLAYGEEASRVKKKLQRLQEMSKLLQRSLEKKAAPTPAAVAQQQG